MVHCDCGNKVFTARLKVLLEADGDNTIKGKVTGKSIIGDKVICTTCGTEHTLKDLGDCVMVVTS